MSFINESRIIFLFGTPFDNMEPTGNTGKKYSSLSYRKYLIILVDFQMNLKQQIINKGDQNNEKEFSN